MEEIGGSLYNQFAHQAWREWRVAVLFRLALKVQLF